MAGDVVQFQNNVGRLKCSHRSLEDFIRNGPK